jgi:hypothetical protein
MFSLYAADVVAFLDMCFAAVDNLSQVVHPSPLACACVILLWETANNQMVLGQVHMMVVVEIEF